MIKPGSVCYLASLPQDWSDYNGRVVTVIRSDYDSRGNFSWVLAADWFRSCELGLYRRVLVMPRNLIPINDPDEPVTTHTPEALTA